MYEFLARHGRCVPTFRIHMQQTKCCPIHKGKGDMNAKLSILAIIVIAATAQVASAQYYQPQHHYGAYPVQYPAAYNGYGNYHHASTLEEGMANGIANLIHSAGAANLLHSQAARNYQEAHSRYLDNRVKA